MHPPIKPITNKSAKENSGADKYKNKKSAVFSSLSVSMCTKLVMSL